MHSVRSVLLKRSGLLLLLAIAIFLFGLNSFWVEQFYSNGLYRFTSLVQRTLTGFIPFPLGDCLYILLSVYLLYSVCHLYKDFVRKRLTRADRINVPLRATSFILFLYIAFKLLWGLNYSRLPIAGQLGISNEKYNVKELALLGTYFIKQANDLQNIKRQHFEISDLSKGAKIAYDKLALKQAFFTYRSPSVKPVLSSWLITKVGIQGYYSPLTGEANMNRMPPDITLPFTTCHEIAHQLGIAREDEANLVGYLVAINSDDASFRYSAILSVLRSILIELRSKSKPDFNRIYATINPITLQDFKDEKDFWKKYSGWYDLVEVAFDRFLKLNNQPKGTESYQDIVLWLYNIHKKDLPVNY